jgi:hypothetical protein
MVAAQPPRFRGVTRLARRHRQRLIQRDRSEQSIITVHYHA